MNAAWHKEKVMRYKILDEFEETFFMLFDTTISALVVN